MHIPKSGRLDYESFSRSLSMVEEGVGDTTCHPRGVPHQVSQPSLNPSQEPNRRAFGWKRSAGKRHQLAQRKQETNYFTPNVQRRGVSINFTTGDFYPFSKLSVSDVLQVRGENILQYS